MPTLSLRLNFYMLPKGMARRSLISQRNVVPTVGPLRAIEFT